MVEQPECKNCASSGWVCENHENLPWDDFSDHPDACGCGAGMPCIVCNTKDGVFPRNPPGESVNIWLIGAGRQTMNFIPKGWRTIAFNAITLLVTIAGFVLQYLGELGFDDSTFAMIAISLNVFVAVANLYLRSVTTTPVGEKY